MGEARAHGRAPRDAGAELPPLRWRGSGADARSTATCPPTSRTYATSPRTTLNWWPRPRTAGTSPIPNQQGDVEKLRERTLLREFEEYKTRPSAAQAVPHRGDARRLQGRLRRPGLRHHRRRRRAPAPQSAAGGRDSCSCTTTWPACGSPTDWCDRDVARRQHPRLARTHPLALHRGRRHRHQGHRGRRSGSCHGRRAGHGDSPEQRLRRPRIR